MSRLGQKARRTPAEEPRGAMTDLDRQLAAVELRAIDWIDDAHTVDELLDDALISMSADKKLVHYREHEPSAIVDEQTARWNALRGINRSYGSDPGSPVNDPWSFDA